MGHDNRLHIDTELLQSIDSILGRYRRLGASMEALDTVCIAMRALQEIIAKRNIKERRETINDHHVLPAKLLIDGRMVDIRIAKRKLLGFKVLSPVELPLEVECIIRLDYFGVVSEFYCLVSECRQGSRHDEQHRGMYFCDLELTESHFSHRGSDSARRSQH